MASYNRVILMGNITRDIQLRWTPGGTPVTEVGLAVSDRRKGQNGEWIDETTFVDVTFWGRTAEVAAEYLSKGSPVFVEGRLKLDTWEKEGQKHSKIRVVCDRMQLIGSRGGAGGEGAPRNPTQAPAAASTAVHQQHDDYGADSRSHTIDNEREASGFAQDEIPF
ncbi:MAG: single-stranded DNA-binding protein [Pirellulaceae bacterium]|jgi:single-strand DNA-binding protein|nr:single-stranded DNA-binding protein [Pirellulaceae bacterium]